MALRYINKHNSTQHICKNCGAMGIYTKFQANRQWWNAVTCSNTECNHTTPGYALKSDALDEWVRA